MTSFKLLMISAVICFAFAHAHITDSPNGTQELNKERNKRALIEIPIIGTILLVATKISGLVTSLLEYKSAAISLVFSIPVWIYQNLLTVIIGTGIVAGFCAFTGMFGTETVPVYEMDHRLIHAERSLDHGIRKYRMLK